MINTNKIILVDDDNQMRKALSQTLELEGFEVVTFPRSELALASLSAEFEGIVISDVRMPGMDGIQFSDKLKNIDPDLPVILITGHGEVPMAVTALQNGAYDFIEKPFPAERLVESAKRALEKRSLILENRSLRETNVSHDDDIPFIGQTPVMERLRNTLRHIADTDVDVLVAGETGSGKEVVATALHRWNKRRSKGQFVALNCGALPESVIESELFGHEAGAYTGAVKKRIGRIEFSSDGTLFLDEIESMPPAIQVKMLRVLEMREISPLGSNELRPVDLRVVAAAKIDLSDAHLRADFREDLYYRLNVVTLSIPPLRERRADIPLLFGYFLQKASTKFSRQIPPITAAVSRHIKDHDWPGNVRELGHFAERVVLGLASSDGVSAQSDVGQVLETLSYRMEKEEAQIIRDALERCNGDVGETVAALGIARKTFYDKLQRHNINRQDFAKRN